MPRVAKKVAVAKKTAPAKKVAPKAPVTTANMVKSEVKAVVKSAPRAGGLSVPVYSLLGRATGNLALPKEVFGLDVNKKLLAQAIRVYTVNQNNFTASTKKRGEVKGSSAKIFRQKGTGRARHGSVRAPIFVGGGVVFGPKPRKVVLDLPKQMRRKALLSALSAKAKDKQVLGLSGMEKATGKTKEIATLLHKLNVQNVLIVTGEKIDNVVRGGRNIAGVDILSSTQLNAYEVLKHRAVLITKEAVDKLSGGTKK